LDTAPAVLLRSLHPPDGVALTNLPAPKSLPETRPAGAGLVPLSVALRDRAPTGAQRCAVSPGGGKSHRPL